MRKRDLIRGALYAVSAVYIGNRTMEAFGALAAERDYFNPRDEKAQKKRDRRCFAEFLLIGNLSYLAVTNGIDAICK